MGFSIFDSVWFLLKFIFLFIKMHGLIIHFKIKIKAQSIGEVGYELNTSSD